MAEIIILMNANYELQDQEKLSMRAQEEHSTNHIWIREECFECTHWKTVIALIYSTAQLFLLHVSKGVVRKEDWVVIHKKVFFKKLVIFSS